MLCKSQNQVLREFWSIENLKCLSDTFCTVVNAYMLTFIREFSKVSYMIELNKSQDLVFAIRIKKGGQLKAKRSRIY